MRPLYTRHYGARRVPRHTVSGLTQNRPDGVVPSCRTGPLESPRQGNGAVEASHKDLLRCAVSLARRFADRTVFVGMPCWNNFA